MTFKIKINATERRTTKNDEKIFYGRRAWKTRETFFRFFNRERKGEGKNECEKVHKEREMGGKDGKRGLKEGERKK